MKITKKLKDRAAYRVNKDLYFGRKSFKDLKSYANRFLQRSSEVWSQLPMPITKKDKKLREFYVSFAFIGGTLLGRIREAEKYRKSIKYRHCRYKKYLLPKNKIVYERTFVKLADHSNRRVLVVITPGKTGRLRAELIWKNIVLPLTTPPVEEGRFRFSPIYLDEFNIFFYPTHGKKYGYKFIGSSIDYLTAKRI